MPEPKEKIVSSLARARVELDDALFELEKLPAISQSSVSFAAHALNNFLTVTGGTVDLLQMSLADHPDPQIRIWLEGLSQATSLMSHTVSQLMSASSDRGTRLRFEKVDLAVMAQRGCLYYQRIADRKGIRCHCEADADVSPVWTDRVMAAAVLDNLLSNAVKYSPPGKGIRVRVSAEGNEVVCEVRDEGPGLTPEDQAMLFQRGVRLSPRPTGDEPSTGFGLAVAKEFVDKLGGSISCESVPGQGACFSVRLPRYQEAEPEPGEPPSVP